MTNEQREYALFFLKKRGKKMPKAKDFIYTIIVVIVIVYAMVFYNVISMKGNNAFFIALKKLLIMGVIAFIFEFFLIGKVAQKLTLKIINSKENKPIFMTIFLVL